MSTVDPLCDRARAICRSVRYTPPVNPSNPTAEIIQHVIENKFRYTYSVEKSLKIPNGESDSLTERQIIE